MAVKTSGGRACKADKGDKGDKAFSIALWIFALTLF
jgi:hypothetical protein